MLTAGPAPPKGLFITFEGIEGSGKTTQSKLLVQRLQAEGFEALSTYEPGGTLLGLALRKLLKEDPNLRISPTAELLLFAAARAQLLEEVIRPALSGAKHVICDRYVESTIAYQGGGRALPRKTIEQALAAATEGLRADLVILIDLPPETGLARKRSTEWDRFEAEDLSFHERVRRSYLAMAEAEPERWLVVDGCQSVAEQHEIIWRRVQALLSWGKRAEPKTKRKGPK